MVRIPPEVHRRLAEIAAEEGVSINRLVSARLAKENELWCTERQERGSRITVE